MPSSRMASIGLGRTGRDGRSGAPWSVPTPAPTRRVLLVASVASTPWCEVNPTCHGRGQGPAEVVAVPRTDPLIGRQHFVTMRKPRAFPTRQHCCQRAATGAVGREGRREDHERGDRVRLSARPAGLGAVDQSSRAARRNRPGRDRVPLRHVRGHARKALRQAGAGSAPSTDFSRTGPGSPGSPRGPWARSLLPPTSWPCPISAPTRLHRGSPAWPSSSATRTARASPGPSPRGSSCGVRSSGSGTTDSP